MSLLCLFGFHKWPKDAEEAAGMDIFRYLLQRCERCGKDRREARRGPIR